MGPGLSAALKRGWLWGALVLLIILCGGWWTQHWTVYQLEDGAFRPQRRLFCEAAPRHSCPTAVYPPSWDIRAATYADVTGDGVPECVLLVWRPWRDWPIMRWENRPSPIADFHDAQGDSAHVIVTVPDGVGGYRELWAGSALPVPLMDVQVGDVDGDGVNELVALDTDYRVGRTGPAHAVSVWQWNGFGFTLEANSPRGRLRALRLAPPNAQGRQLICLRGNFTATSDVLSLSLP